jgi:hypothetical protein
MRAAGTRPAAVTGDKDTVTGFVTMENVLEEPAGPAPVRPRRGGARPLLQSASAHVNDAAASRHSIQGEAAGRPVSPTRTVGLHPDVLDRVRPCDRFELDMTSQPGIALPSAPGLRTGADADIGRPLHGSPQA